MSFFVLFFVCVFVFIYLNDTTYWHCLLTCLFCFWLHSLMGNVECQCRRSFYKMWLNKVNTLNMKCYCCRLFYFTCKEDLVQ
ncbi:hypothetical protein V8C35DRAFT_54850 [Trichoderma chlorosporum]